MYYRYFSRKIGSRLPLSAFFQACALILIPSGFLDAPEMQSNYDLILLAKVPKLLNSATKATVVDRPLFINPGIKTKP